MPQSKTAYQTSGQLAAKEGRSREAGGLKEGSWQHRAWLAGYDSAPKAKATTISDLALCGPETGRTSSRAIRNPVDFVAVRTQTAHWPAPAREHVVKLYQDAEHESSSIRLQRLLRAAARMTKRHGVKT